LGFSTRAPNSANGKDAACDLSMGDQGWLGALKDAANIEAGLVAHQSADFDEGTTALGAKRSNVS
jgi:hypothetical protein